ncbi:sec14p-like phosphatidylinositol transfer family protein [Wolffia australiana]
MAELGFARMEGKAGWNGSPERKKVSLMRKRVEMEDPDAKAVDDLMLRRFLRARDLDIAKGSAMFLKYFKWRKTQVPRGFICEADVQNELSQNKLFSQGFDKAGNPIGVIFGGRHDYSTRNIDEFRRVVVFGLDKLIARMPPEKEKFVFIADIKGWCYANSDIRAYLAALEIMQNYYPERLKKVFMVHVPSMFLRAWKIIYPFIDDNTKQKYVFVDDKNLKATLLEEIDESQLPEIYGGKLPLVPVQDT